MNALVLHCWSSFAMTGLIWFAQIVHYPLFEIFERRWFSMHARRHARLTAFVAGPIMLLEFGSGLYLIAIQFEVSLVSISFLLLILIWISTFAIQMPLHAKLQREYDPSAISQLVSSNWIRTGLWSLRSLMLAFALTKGSLE